MGDMLVALNDELLATLSPEECEFSFGMCVI